MAVCPQNQSRQQDARSRKQEKPAGPNETDLGLQPIEEPVGVKDALPPIQDVLLGTRIADRRLGVSRIDARWKCVAVQKRFRLGELKKRLEVIVFQRLAEALFEGSANFARFALAVQLSE